MLAGVFWRNINSFPTNYLGLPGGARLKGKAIWDLIIERLEERLFGISACFLCLFTLTSVASKLEAMRRILMGFLGNDFKYHLVRWNTVKQLVFQTGLGVRDLQLFNKIIGKWLWRSFVERWLPSNVMRLVLVGFLLLVMVLIGIASGFRSQRHWRDSFRAFSLM